VQAAFVEAAAALSPTTLRTSASSPSPSPSPTAGRQVAEGPTVAAAMATLGRTARPSPVIAYEWCRWRGDRACAEESRTPAEARRGWKLVLKVVEQLSLDLQYDGLPYLDFVTHQEPTGTPTPPPPPEAKQGPEQGPEQG